MIAAVAENQVIGKNNDLVWRLPDDMKYFMETTQNHFVIMGRKNYDSIPEKYSPLPNRINIIITRQKDYQADGCLVFDSLQKAFDYAENKGQSEVFVIGGGEIYTLALAKADKLYITEVKASFEGDTFFPEIDESKWLEVSRKPHSQDSRHHYNFDFVVYKRKIPR